MGIIEEKQYWDIAASDQDVDRKYICDIDTDTCLKALSPINNVFEYEDNGKLSILDVGCGVGRLAIPIAERFLDSNVIGIDISQAMLDIANKRSKAKNFTTKLTDGRTIPYPDDTFMAAYSMLVFQHIPNDAKESYIKEAARVLMQGGVFRVQFVDTDIDGLMSYGINKDEIITMFKYAGFKIDSIDIGLVHPQWTWVTGVKI